MPRYAPWLRHGCTPCKFGGTDKITADLNARAEALQNDLETIEQMAQEILDTIATMRAEA